MNRPDVDCCDVRGAGGLLGGGAGRVTAGAGAGAPEGGGRGAGPGAGAVLGPLLPDELAAARRSLVTDNSMLGSSPSVAASSSELFLMPYMKYIAKPVPEHNTRSVHRAVSRAQALMNAC